MLRPRCEGKYRPLHDASASRSLKLLKGAYNMKMLPSSSGPPSWVPSMQTCFPVSSSPTGRMLSLPLTLNSTPPMVTAKGGAVALQSTKKVSWSSLNVAGGLKALANAFAIWVHETIKAGLGIDSIITHRSRHKVKGRSGVENRRAVCRELC
jgi:hypothetical protein